MHHCFLRPQRLPLLLLLLLLLVPWIGTSQRIVVGDGTPHTFVYSADSDAPITKKAFPGLRKKANDWCMGQELAVSLEKCTKWVIRKSMQKIVQARRDDREDTGQSRPENVPGSSMVHDDIAENRGGTSHFVWMRPIECAGCDVLLPLWNHLPETFPTNTWEIRRCVDSRRCNTFGLELPGSEMQFYDGKSNIRPMLNWVEKHSLTDSLQLHRNFDIIYDLSIWKGHEKESTSGTGSEIGVNEQFVKFLNDLIARHSISSIVDVGSGDWNYMKEVPIASYTGYDVSASIVKKTAASYGSANVSFHLSELNQVYKAADMLICKDVLQHLPLDAVRHILKQRKKYKIAIFVNDVGEDAAEIPNIDIIAGNYRSFDLQKPPFNLKCDQTLQLHPDLTKKKTTCVFVNTAPDVVQEL